ncbi:BZ3500_MvSof-1268-A1-R1_Chr12-3g03999 [Microbotryum saponariae]|uniref:protein-tyrosine-phosphatase n=1 Tax=Microbotryum saponariae TaxID=289078 RepID=A0A2X0MRR6_9BASI|nr:BZ3500_MvSof-1268-A1-R1_Chr12-3g03999 [Microbotryum saponariae]SDA02510.1 BZ3501_MvSof-1269-A2-R1_Chr12-3g03654 [Microbotryum saponariae]
MPQNEPDLHTARLAPPTTPSRRSPSLLLTLDRLTSSPASKRSLSRGASPPIPGQASGSGSDDDDDDDDDGASSNASTTLWGRSDSGKDLDPMLTDHSDFGDEDEQCAPSAGGLALRGGATGSRTGGSTANVLAATATTTPRSRTARTIKHGNRIFDRPKSESCSSVPPSTGISVKIPIPTRHSNSLPLTSRPLDSVDHPKSSGPSATAPSSLDTTVRTTAPLATPSFATPVLGPLFAPSTKSKFPSRPIRTCIQPAHILSRPRYGRFLVTSPAQSAYPLSSRDRDNSSSVFLFPPRASTSPTETSSGDAFPLSPGPTSESPTQAGVHITAHELSKKLERNRESTTTSLVIDVRPVQDFLGPNGRIKGSVNMAFPALLMRRLSKPGESSKQTCSFDLHQFVTTDEGKLIVNSIRGSYGVIVVGDVDEDDHDSHSSERDAVEVLLKILRQKPEVEEVSVLKGSLANAWSENGLSAEWRCIGREDSAPARSQPTPTFALPSSPRSRSITANAVMGSGDTPPEQPTTPTFLSLAPARMSISPRSAAPRARPLRLDTSESSLGWNTSKGAPTAPPNMMPGARSLQSLCRIQASERPSERPAIPRAVSSANVPSEAFSNQRSDESDFDPSTILPSFLYLGPEPATMSDVEQLQAMGVETILNLAIECKDSLVRSVYSRANQYHHFPLRDVVEETGIQAVLSRSCQLIDACQLRNEPVYVHCRAGKSRSVMIVVAYLVQSHKMSLDQAYSFVGKRRKGVSPNIGFMAELMKWEEKVRETSHRHPEHRLPKPEMPVEGVR